MNTNPVPLVTLPINVAHLMSLAGCLREILPIAQHTIFSLQVGVQAKMQGFDIFNIESFDYEEISKQSMNFSVPIDCIVDVGNILVSAHKDPQTAKETKDALGFLCEVWAPFANAAVTALKGKEIRSPLDLGPESLN
jgi:hypothetical protein